MKSTIKYDIAPDGTPFLSLEVDYESTDPRDKIANMFAARFRAGMTYCQVHLHPTNESKNIVNIFALVPEELPRHAENITKLAARDPHTLR